MILINIWKKSTYENLTVIIYYWSKSVSNICPPSFADIPYPILESLRLRPLRTFGSEAPKPAHLNRGTNGTHIWITYSNDQIHHDETAHWKKVNSLNAMKQTATKQPAVEVPIPFLEPKHRCKPSFERFPSATAFAFS